MERILIRHNEYANSGVISQGKAKTRLFNQALALAEEHLGTIPKTDYKTFGDNFRAYILSNFRERTKDFASHFSNEKLFDFFDFPNHVLITLETKWRDYRFIEMSDDFQSIVLKDDGQQYAETEDEIERLKAVQQLIKSAEWIAESGQYIDFNMLSRACPNVIIPTGNKTAVPNEIYVKQHRY
jgi:hypothetical protein